MTYPGQQVVEKAYQDGRVEKCDLCGAMIIGWALACVRPGCPVQASRRDLKPGETPAAWGKQS